MHNWPLKEPLFEKLKDFKKSTVKALAYNTLDGPLCDALLPMVSLCDVQKEIGYWHWNKETGHTHLESTGDLCKAEMPRLTDGAKNIHALKELMRTQVFRGLAV